MNVKDLVISLKVKDEGLEKLKAFNKEIKTNTITSLNQLLRVLNIGYKRHFSKEILKENKGNVFSFVKNSLGNINEYLSEVFRTKISPTVKKLSKETFGRKGLAAPVIASLIYIGRSIVDIIKKIGSLVISLSQASYELMKLNRNFGLSTDAMQQFGYAAVASGVKMSDFNSAIAGLKKQSADIMLGRGNISPYALLGLNPHEDPIQLLVHLQQRLRELPEAIGTAFASDLGLSPDMINFVRSGEFARMQARPKLSQSELRTIERTRNLLLDVMNMFSLLGQKLISYLSPYIEIVFGRLNFYLKSAISNTESLSSTFIAAIIAIETAMLVLAPKMTLVLNILTAIALIIDDIVGSGGEGLLVWIEYLSIKISKILSELLGIDVSSDKIEIPEHAGVKKWTDQPALPVGALVPGVPMRAIGVNQNIWGEIKIDLPDGTKKTATVGSPSSGSDLSVETSISGTTEGD